MKVFMKISVALLILCLTNISYAEFPIKQVEYSCRVGLYSLSHKSKCIKEQKDLYKKFSSMLLSARQIKNSLKYGYRYNGFEEVVGIDFHKVLQRAKYLKHKGELK